MSQTTESLNTENETYYLLSTCDRYWSKKNYHNYKVVKVYEGIPETFIIGLIVLLLLLLLFSCVRRKIWNHGCLALVHHMENSERCDEPPEYNIWSTLYFGGIAPSDRETDERCSIDYRLDRQDQGLLSWIPSFLRVTDEEMLRKCGQDAVHYLKFQKYLMAYSLIVAVTCLAVVLPLNLTQGDLEGDKWGFGSSTINNLSPDSEILWVHCSIGICFLCLAIVFMQHFVKGIRRKSDETASKTVMIYNIPQDKCFKNLITQYFEEAYPECEVSEVQFAYDVHHLSKLSEQRAIAEVGLKYSEMQAIETGVRPKIFPYHCSALCCCKCCTAFGAKEVDAINFYTELFDTYDGLCEAEKVKAFQTLLGFAFVTFEEAYMAVRVNNDFSCTCDCRRRARTSSLSRPLDVDNWSLRIAPSPDDVYWDNLSVKPCVWWMKTLAANLFLLVLVLFFTTPTVVINELGEIHIFSRLHGISSNYFVKIIARFIPTLLLVAVSALLPLVVMYTDVLFIGYFTKTTLNHSVMIKVYIFMIIMVIIMPALGFSSILQFVKYGGFRWSCIFDSSSYAFYVNYMTSSATIGVGLALLRILPLLIYIVKLGCVRSKVERKLVEKSEVTEFEYGLSYARTLCQFAVMMVYSIPNPLITIPVSVFCEQGLLSVPLGVLYHVLRYYCDRHNLYYAFRPSKIDNKVHETATYFVVTALILLMLHLLCFFTLRADMVKGINIFLIVVVTVILVVFFFATCMRKSDPLQPSVAGKYESLSERQLQQDSARENKTIGKNSFMPLLLTTTDSGDAKGLQSRRKDYGSVSKRSDIPEPETESPADGHD